MKQIEKNISIHNLSPREKEVYDILSYFNSANKHKMLPIPICIIPKKYKI